MAIDKNGVVFDYHGGIKDLKAELIRAVGEPEERFLEDALRMLRAIRFSTQLGFIIDDQTMIAIQKLAPFIEKIAMERIQIEFTKFLQGKYFVKQSQTLIDSLLYQHLPFPDKFSVQDVVYQLQQDFKPYEEKMVEKQEVFVWGMLLYHLQVNNEEDERQLLRQWKHSNELVNKAIEFKQLRQLPIEAVLEPFNLYQYNTELLLLLEAYYLLQQKLTEPIISQQLAQLPMQSRKEMQINGQQLMRILKIDKGGPMLGQLISEIEKEIVQSRLLNDFEEIEKFVRLKMS